MKKFYYLYPSISTCVIIISEYCKKGGDIMKKFVTIAFAAFLVFSISTSSYAAAKPMCGYPQGCELIF